MIKESMIGSSLRPWRVLCSTLLLPQVPVEHGWDRETFLEHLCLKAGLPTDAWHHADTVLEVFTAEVFGEQDPELKDL
jgi:AMMECR1 domain-containing protein